MPSLAEQMARAWRDLVLPAVAGALPEREDDGGNPTLRYRDENDQGLPDFEGYGYTSEEARERQRRIVEFQKPEEPTKPGGEGADDGR